MSDSEGSSKRIKVVDRRRFTEDGSPREGMAGQTTPDAQPGPAQAPPAADARAVASSDPIPESRGTHAGSASTTATSHDFVELVAMLAQQAEMILVGSEDLPAQPAQAKRLIDYLGALETKTHGNLSDEERQLLTNIVFELRTMFVQATR